MKPITITVDYDVLNRALARIKHRVTVLDGDLMNIPVGAPRRASKQAEYDQTHADYMALSKAVLAGMRS